MSSHHIIRDNQEPALFICGENFNYKIINQLLEWNPLILINKNFHHLSDIFLLKPDFVFEHSNLEELKIFIQKKNIFFANAIGLNSFEEYAFLKNIKPLELSYFCDDWKYVKISEKFEKWLPKDTEVIIKTKTTHTNLTRVSGEIYKVISDGMVSIHPQQETYIAFKV